MQKAGNGSIPMFMIKNIFIPVKGAGNFSPLRIL